MSTFDDAPHHLKPPADPATYAYRTLREGEFWRNVPAYRDIDEATFMDHVWQGRHSVKTPEELLETIKDLVPVAFFDDARKGFKHAPMAVRVSPYMIASIDWSNAYNDP